MRRLIWITLLGSLFVAGQASAQDSAPITATGDVAEDGEVAEEVEADAEVAAVEEEKALPVGLSISTGGSFGAASLVSDSKFTQTDYFASNVSVGASYSPIDEITVGLGIGYSKYLTDDGSVFIREGRLSDTSLSVGWAGWTEENTGLHFGVGGSATFPTSRASQFQRRYLGTGLSGSVSRGFGGLSLSYGLGYSKNFHEFTSVVVDPDELDILARNNGAENVTADLVAEGGVLGSFSVSNSFNMGFGFLERFNAGLGLTFIDSWTYDNGTITKRDEFTNENAVVGRGHSQVMVGSLSLGYRPHGVDWLSTGISATTAGPPLASDNKSFRFPWWDFENGIAARTSLSLRLSASY